VVVSDHGQSLGAPFEDLYGKSLGDVCAELTRQDVVSLEENVESWGRVGSVVDDLAGDSLGGQTAARASSRLSDRAAPDRDPSAGDLVVLGSGNLGLVYVPGPERLVREQIDERWPRLLPGLAATPGVGFIAVQSHTQGQVVIGADGYRLLADDSVSGVDPLAAFPAHAAWALLRAMEMPSAPDIYVNSSVDPATLEVSAFEGLVGSHGGLGGWQDRGLFIAPVGLFDGAEIRGAEQLHEILVSMLVRLGQRSDLQRPVGMAHQ
jgi:hypothetical protein